jgi:hypothetical protein
MTDILDDEATSARLAKSIHFAADGSPRWAVVDFNAVRAIEHVAIGN